MVESSTIVYNASTGETYTDTITGAAEVTEAVDTIIDNTDELAKLNAKIAEFESLMLALSDENTSLKTKVEALTSELGSINEVKTLIADIKTTDPKLDNTFLVALTSDQLKIIKESFARILN